MPAKNTKQNTKQTEVATPAPVAAPVPAVKEVQADAQPVVERTRFFKLVTLTETGERGSTRGRFSGKKPKQAANKALTSLLKDMKKTDGGKPFEGSINFIITECTRGCGAAKRNKLYHYVGERVVLDTPVSVTIKGKEGADDKTITYGYTNRVTKLKVEGGKPIPKPKKVTKKAVAKKQKPATKKVAKKEVPEKPTAKKVAKKEVVAEKPATKKAAEPEKPATKKVAEKPVAKKAAESEKPAAKKVAEKPAAKKEAVSEKPVAKKAAEPEKPAAKKVVSKK